MQGAEIDYLEVFTGVKAAQFRHLLQGMLQARGVLEERLLTLFTRNPLEANVAFVFASAMAFFLAERGVNTKVVTYVDALYYVSTCLSVGYADIFPVTQRGKAIATLVMTVGPALSSELLDPPSHALGASESGQERIVTRLEDILEELRKQHNLKGVSDE